MSEKLLVLVEKNREHHCSPAEVEAIKMVSKSEAFYSLTFTKEQLTKFWAWYNEQIKQETTKP